MMRLIKKLLAPKHLLVVAVIYTSLLTWGSLVSPESLPQIEEPGFDKILHLLGYFGLLIVWFLFVFFKSKRMKYRGQLIIIAFSALFYGIIIEVLQELITAQREADIQDIFANLTGLVLAYVLLLLFVPKLKKLKNSI